MIGLILVTHGNLAKEFLAAMEHVVGKQENAQTVCIGPDDDMEERQQEILEKTQKVNSGNGVIILTDMFGGTPSNLAISIMDQGDIEIVAGVNLPMLIKIATARETQPLRELTVMAKESGQKYIHIASEVLNSKES